MSNFSYSLLIRLLFFQARIKAKAIAINTFMPKNGYRPVEVNPYAQQRYTSYYIPPVYSPQQQFPLYSLITPQAWSTTHSFIDPTLVRDIGQMRQNMAQKIKDGNIRRDRVIRVSPEWESCLLKC